MEKDEKSSIGGGNALGDRKITDSRTSIRSV